jgi:hypothetical protein
MIVEGDNPAQTRCPLQMRESNYLEINFDKKIAREKWLSLSPLLGFGNPDFGEISFNIAVTKYGCNLVFGIGFGMYCVPPLHFHPPKVPGRAWPLACL